MHSAKNLVSSTFQKPRPTSRPFLAQLSRSATLPVSASATDSAVSQALEAVSFRRFLYNVYFCIVETPSPGTYHFKSTVGERQPTIVGNALTTSFKNQAARSAFDKVYVPGARSAKGYEYIPGPGAYMLRNK